MPYNHIRSYEQTRVQTASQADLVLALYEGVLRCLAKARISMIALDIESTHEQLVKAQDIILELMTSLNMEAGSLAQNLFDIYGYLYRRLVEANARKDVEAVEDVERLVGELLPAWRSAGQSEAQRRSRQMALSQPVSNREAAVSGRSWRT